MHVAWNYDFFQEMCEQAKQISKKRTTSNWTALFV